MARTHLSTIQRRDQTAAIEVWEEEDGGIVEYIDGNPSVTAKINPVTGGSVFSSGGKDYSAQIGLLPSGDTTGATDRVNLEAAVVLAAAGKCSLVLGGGQFYVASKDVGTTNADPGVPLLANVEVCGSGHRATRIQVVGGSKCNIFVAESIDGWAVRNIYMDGSRDDPAMPITGGSLDNLRNCIRVKACSDWEVSDCTLTKAAYHGIIGVRTCTNVRVINNDFIANGFRPVHLHDEASGVPGQILIQGNRCDGDGAGIFPGLSISAEVQAGALTKLRVSAADAVKLAQIFAASITGISLAIPNAGTAGVTHFTTATLSAGNPDVSNDLTLTIPALQASGVVTVRVIAEMTSGIFVVFGCEKVIVSNNQIYNQMAQGLDVAGSSTATDQQILISGNLVNNCAVGMQLGYNNANATPDISAWGNKIYNSAFEGLRINNVTHLTWDGEIVGSGGVGVQVVTYGTTQDSISIGGVVRNSGASGIYARGGGELNLLHVSAKLENNGLNAAFTTSSLNYYTTYSLGIGMGILVNPDSASKYHSVIIDSPSVRKNSNGGAHVNYCDHARVSIKSCIDNVFAAGGAAVAVRLNTVLSGSIENTDAMLRTRTDTEYAISCTGCTNITIRGNRTNYTRSSNVIYCSGTGCTAYDNIGPAGTTVQYASGGAAASDAAMQRVA